MSETEDQKQQLVQCIRMLEHSDIIDYNGHASIRAGDNRMFGSQMPRGNAFPQSTIDAFAAWIQSL